MKKITLNEISKLRIKLIAYLAVSFLATTLPVTLVLIINWGRYTGYTTAGSLKIGAGAIIGGVFVLLKLIGKLRMPKRIVLFAIVCAMSYLLQPLLSDLLLISAMALVGEFVDYLFLQTAINGLEERIKAEKISDASAAKVENIIKKYTSGEMKNE